MASLQTLVDDLHVRRADVRATMTALHREGLVNVINTTLTLEGFALAMRFKQVQLPPLRGHQSPSVAAA